MKFPDETVKSHLSVEEAEEPVEWRMPGVRTIMDIGDDSEDEDGEYMVSEE